MTFRVNRFAYLDDRDVAYALHALNELPRAVAHKHLRIGLNAWGGEVKNILGFTAPRDTGLLRKSFGVKVKIPDASFNTKHHGKPAYVLVGPKRRSGRMMRRSNRGKLIGFGLAQKELQIQRTASGVLSLRPLARERAAVKLAKSLHPGAVYKNPTRYAHLAERKHGYMKRAEAVGKRLGQTALLHKIRQGVFTEAAILHGKQNRFTGTAAT